VPSPGIGARGWHGQQLLPRGEDDGICEACRRTGWAAGPERLLGGRRAQPDCHAHRRGGIGAYLIELNAVSAVSASDVWAVGSYSLGGKALIRHWNGSAWTQGPSPDPRRYQMINGVSAVSPRDALAAGWTETTKTSPAYSMLLRWNGQAWLRTRDSPTSRCVPVRPGASRLE
jgi:hypothetical protein